MINIACHTPNCSNPIIGQCSGYNRTCGLYFCATHTGDRLCSECYFQKRVEEENTKIYNDYLLTAEKIGTGNGCGLYMFSFTIFTLFVIVGAILEPNKNPIPGSGNSGFIVMAIFSTIGIIVGIAILFKAGASARKKVVAMDKIKPGFEDFHNRWSKLKDKEELKTALGIGFLVGGTVVGMAAAAAQSNRDAENRLNAQQVRQDIRDIKKSLE